MVEERNGTESEISSTDVITALNSISQTEWESADWPLVVSVPKGIYYKFEEHPEIDNKQAFWKEVLNPENFVNPNSGDRYKPKEHILFIFHSFSDRNGQESIIKAITTSPKSLVEDPGNMINYRHHGQPCEIRSKQIYPTYDFWDFYDNLSREDQNIYAIPSKESRKQVILNRFFNK